MFKSLFINTPFTKQADMRNFNARIFCRSKVLMLCLLVSASKLTAQTDIAIGTGTTGNNNTSYPCPLQDFYEGSRMQFLYTAAELTAAGMMPGNITSLKFDVQALTTSAGMTEMEGMEIRIGGTTTGSLSATTWEGGLAPVFGPVDYTATLGVN